MTHTAQRVLVAGKSGFLASRVSSFLRKRHYDVLHVTRKVSAGSDDISWEDLAKKGLPENVNAVVNMCGCNVLNPLRRWTPEFELECVESRHAPALALGQAISSAKSPPSAFVQISGVGFYDTAQNIEASPCTESSHHGSGVWANFQTEVERIASEALHTQKQTRLIMLRCGVVLGAQGGAIAQMYPAFLCGLGGRIGSGVQPFPFIHIDDVCGLVEHAIKSSDIEGGLIATAPQIVSNYDFTKALGRALNRPTLIPFPEWAVKLVFSATRSQLLLEGPVVHPKKALDTGFQFQYANIDDALHHVCKRS